MGSGAAPLLAGVVLSARVAFLAAGRRRAREVDDATTFEEVPSARDEARRGAAKRDMVVGGGKVWGVGTRGRVKE